MNTVTSTTGSTRPTFRPQALLIGLLFILCAPLGLYRLWRMKARWFVMLPYALLGVPLSLALQLYVAIIAFAAVLPELDLSVPANAPRTIRFAHGNYESTFLETGRDTHGTHESIRVQIQPKGGNSAHYHRQFEETFTVEKGQLEVALGSSSVVLQPGQSATARRGQLHWFENPGDTVTTMVVRVVPARGLEKSLRVAYGLDGANMWSTGTRMQNMWRRVLMLGYSETFLPGTHPWFQEPLIAALARIAQWLGKDEELQVFFGDGG